jgi:hypothetical protein
MWNPLPHNQPGTHFQNWPDINFKSQGTWKEWIENYDSFTFIKYPNLIFWNTQKWSVLWLWLFWNTWNCHSFEKSINHPTLCNLKTMSDVFCGWRLQTLIQLCGWNAGGMVFQGRWRNCFLVCFYFWNVLLFRRLLQRDLGELISVMEHDPSYSMKTLHELCESWFCEGIGEEISREWRDEEWKSYMTLAEENRGWIFSEEKKLSC